MVELFQVRDFIQKIVQGITLATEIDTQVYDSLCNRVAGTVTLPLPAYGGVVRDVIKTGNPHVCTEPLQDPMCIDCIKREHCEEKGFIHYPIIFHQKVVGVMGLICYDAKQAAKINDEHHKMVEFVESMCSLIELKLKDYEISEKEAERFQAAILQNDIMLQIINQMPNGYLYVNESGIVINCNNRVGRIFGRPATDIKGHNVQELFPDLNLQQLSEKHIHSVVLLCRIGTEEYSLLITYYYDQLCQIGFSIIIKPADNTGINQDPVNQQKIKQIQVQDLIGSSTIFKSTKNELEIAANKPINILLAAENGTEVDIIARAIHNGSLRADLPFITVDCSYLDEQSAKTILFGKLSASSSGNMYDIGKLELANSGILYLSHIDQMPLYTQKLLAECLKQQFIVTEAGNIPLDLRIISSSDKDLFKFSDAGGFSKDLFYCINGITIHIPPLRDRGDDILLIASYYLHKYETFYGYKDLKFSPEIKRKFIGYNWPDNIMEVDHVVQYCLSKHDVSKKIILDKTLPENFSEKASDSKFKSQMIKNKGSSFRHIENETIISLINEYGNSTNGKKKVAEELGISMATLYRRIKEIKNK